MLAPTGRPGDKSAARVNVRSPDDYAGLPCRGIQTAPATSARDARTDSAGGGDHRVAWQSRPLEPTSPVVFFDALRVKIRDDAVVRNKAVYLALGVLPDGTREVLGIWI
jgi:hypothetical protein